MLPLKNKEKIHKRPLHSLVEGSDILWLKMYGPQTKYNFPSSTENYFHHQKHFISYTTLVIFILFITD